MAFSATQEQQAHIIENAMGNADGRMLLAQKLMDPIKQERDYSAMGRQGFIIDPLAQGEAPYYDSDIKTMAVVIPARGEIPQLRANSQRVQVPIFPLASFPMVAIDDTKIRRFNILERIQTKARADIAEEEDRLIFGDMATVDFSVTTYGGQNKNAKGGISAYRYATPVSTDSWYSATTGGTEDIFDHLVNEVVTSDIGVTRELLVGMYGAVLKHDLQPDTFLMHPQDYIDLFTWGRDDLDPEAQKEVRQTGRMGSLWGVEINISKIVPRGTLYCRTSDEYFGVMPILIDLDVMDAPNPRGLAYGFAFYEFIGITILNAWGVSRGTVTR